MRILLLALGSACLSTSPAFAAKKLPGLQFSWSLAHGTRIKENRVIGRSASLTGYTLSVSGPYGPCQLGQCAGRALKFDLSKAEHASLVVRLKALGLTGKYVERKPADLIGKNVGARISGQWRKRGRAWGIEISGMTYVYKLPDGKPPSAAQRNNLSEEAKRMLTAFEQFKTTIEALIRKRYPGAVH